MDGGGGTDGSGQGWVGGWEGALVGCLAQLVAVPALVDEREAFLKIHILLFFSGSLSIGLTLEIVWAVPYSLYMQISFISHIFKVIHQ